jgi:hypothetical protein
LFQGTRRLVDEFGSSVVDMVCHSKTALPPQRPIHVSKPTLPRAAAKSDPRLLGFATPRSRRKR